MGLDTVIKAAAVTAFNVVGDLLVTATFKQAGTKQYDPDSGGTKEYGETTVPNLEFLRETYTDREIENSRALSTDRKMSIPANTLGSTITPKVGDKILIGSASDAVSTDNEWRIEEVTTDPASALWVLRVRQ